MEINNLPVGLQNLLNKLTPVKVDYVNGDPDYDDSNRQDVSSLEDANTVSSKIKETEGFHKVLLDLDVPHYLVSSSTPGHGHLYIDVTLTEKKYMRLLSVLRDCGIIEPGFESVSNHRKASHLRLPGVKK